MKEYDLIFSLGGNCSAAHNLRVRKLRDYSLPFDWLYIVDDKPIYYLSEGFRNSFKDLCKKENLKPLDKEEDNNAHLDRVKYKDDFTKYRFVNHFNKDIHKNKNEYKKVSKKIEKRIRRLYDLIATSDKILCILAVSFPIEIDALRHFKQTMQELYPSKTFDYILLRLNSLSDATYDDDGITVYDYKRPINNYDVQYTNWEWAFLDNIKLTKRRMFCFQRIKHGFSIIILESFPRIFHTSGNILGLRYDFSIGKR